MAGVSLDKSVSKADDGTWSFQCPGFSDSLCGDVGGSGRPFHSDEWPTKDLAKARGRQHFTEHAFPDRPTPSLEEFRAEHGLVVDENGRAQLASVAALESIVED